MPSAKQNTEVQMKTLKAVYYGELELILGIVCDVYVLSDGAPVMSERGVAKLLGMDQKTLMAVRGNWPPKTLQPFINQGDTVRGNFVEVATNKSPHCGRNIAVYTAQSIRILIHAYASALLSDGLRKNQIHIGQRAISLSVSLLDTALETAMKEACGLPVNIQATAQKNYTDIVELLKETNFHCSVKGKDIAIKNDIANYLDVPKNTLNRYLSKHKDVIKPYQARFSYSPQH